MRITIDTDLQVIIVPDSYYDYVDKLNEIIKETGGEPLDHTKYIETLFQKAYKTKIIRPGDIPKNRGTKNRRKNNAADSSTEAKEDAKPAAAEGEKK